VPDSESGGTGFDSLPGRDNAKRNIIVQDVHSQVLTPAKPVASPGSINWYRPRLRLTSFVRLLDDRGLDCLQGGCCVSVTKSALRTTCSSTQDRKQSTVKRRLNFRLPIPYLTKPFFFEWPQSLDGSADLNALWLYDAV
jgi:hypothetical protein